MKRKADDARKQHLSSEVTAKAPRATKKNKSTAKSKADTSSQDTSDWPEYLNTLFKIFKALNTVLAFVSSRKQLATTFPVVRSSVEALLKQPLELNQVAEIKAILPDVIKFGYIPRDELRIHGEGIESKRRESPDFSIPSSSKATMDSQEHVLLLEFADNSRGKKSGTSAMYSTPPALSPAAMKKLVEKRNTLFQQAINDLLSATPAGEDPVLWIKAAGRDHVPIDPLAHSLPGLAYDLPHGVPDHASRPSVEAVLTEVRLQPWFKDQIIEQRRFEPKPAKQGRLELPFSDAIKAALETSRGIRTLYSHQTAAIDALGRGNNVIVSTSTASGKSVIYQVPVLRFLEENPDSTAIFVYPTKALAQDQKAAMEQLIHSCSGLEHINVSTYDGDTPQEHRREIRETASVIFTNFDMIHTSILPHEELWRRFLKNLKLFAVDELHYYTGLFGSHVAQIMRRFRRVCAAVGNRRTRYVSCSATIAKPGRHMQIIFGVDNIVEVTEDGAPSGRKDFIIWQPPLVDDQVPALGRRSSISEAVGLMRFLMKRGVRCILFCKIRKICELAMKTLRADLSSDGRLDILERTVAYRGGYSPEDRRRIENDAFSGNILGIVATNALELGVDIGVLDAVIMLGFPVTLASFRQQAGRAGRRAQDSLAVFVPDVYPVDNHYLQRPSELWDRPMNELVVDLESEVILEAHLQCASHEMPISVENDEFYFGPLTKTICETRLVKDKDGWYHPHPRFLPSPSRHIFIRGAMEDKYVVIDYTDPNLAKVLEEVEVSRALFELYEGGVFIHQGLTFIIKQVSHDSKVAHLVRADVNWITSPRDFTNVDAVQTYRIKQIKKSVEKAFFGKVNLYTKVFGFYKIRNKVILDAVDLETEAWERETTGMWMDVPRSILEVLKAKEINPAEAIHSAQHAFLNNFAMAVDVRTECKVSEKEYMSKESTRKRPARLIFYDLPTDGGAVAVKAFDRVSDLLTRACDAVNNCACEEGCTNCILSASCKENNEVYSKIGARLILQGILGRNIDLNDVPAAEPSGKFSTIVEADKVPVVAGVEVEIASP